MEPVGRSVGFAEHDSCFALQLARGSKSCRQQVARAPINERRQQLLKRRLRISELRTADFVGCGRGAALAAASQIIEQQSSVSRFPLLFPLPLEPRAVAAAAAAAVGAIAIGGA